MAAGSATSSPSPLHWPHRFLRVRTHAPGLDHTDHVVPLLRPSPSPSQGGFPAGDMVSTGLTSRPSRPFLSGTLQSRATAVSSLVGQACASMTTLLISETCASQTPFVHSQTWPTMCDRAYARFLAKTHPAGSEKSRDSSHGLCGSRTQVLGLGPAVLQSSSPKAHSGAHST